MKSSVSTDRETQLIPKKPKMKKMKNDVKQYRFTNNPNDNDLRLLH